MFENVQTLTVHECNTQPALKIPNKEVQPTRRLRQAGQTKLDQPPTEHARIAHSRQSCGAEDWRAHILAHGFSQRQRTAPGLRTSGYRGSSGLFVCKFRAPAGFDRKIFAACPSHALSCIVISLRRFRILPHTNPSRLWEANPQWGRKESSNSPQGRGPLVAGALQSRGITRLVVGSPPISVSV